MSQNIRRVGVIGGGQLAWMMAGAAQKLGLELVVQTPSSSDPAVEIAADVVFAPIDDVEATARLASGCDVITFENEFIDLEGLTPLSQQGVRFRPRLEALAPLLDKYDQRCYLRDIGLPVPQFAASIEEMNQLPIVVKARRHGYDGQGTFIFKEAESLSLTLEKLGQTPILVEEYVPFERELAVVAARSVAGDVVLFPVVETQQVNQVCRWAIAPAQISLAVQAEVEAIAKTLLDRLQVVGIFGIELFLTADDKVLVNEIAPRTHNSGHFTLNACETSQFEQQLRAVSEFPLGNSALICQGAVMVNLLGYEHTQNDYFVKRQQLAEIPQSHVYWYGKTESRPGRKLGHVTVLLDSSKREDAIAIAQKIESIWYPS